MKAVAVGAHHTTVPCRSAGRHLTESGLAGFRAMACERYSRLSGDLSPQTDAIVTVGPASHTNCMHISGMGNMPCGVSRRYVILTACISRSDITFEHLQTPRICLHKNHQALQEPLRIHGTDKLLRIPDCQVAPGILNHEHHRSVMSYWPPHQTPHDAACAPFI